MAMHHEDFLHALTLLIAQGEQDAAGRLCMHLARILATKPAPDLVSLILEQAPLNPDGLSARVTLEWIVGRPQHSLDYAEQALALLQAEDPRVPFVLQSSCPAYSFVGQPDLMVDTARRVVVHSASPDSLRVSGVGLWALGEYYRGDHEAACRVLADNHEVLGLGAMAFIDFVRAELAAATDPDEAFDWLEQGALQARLEGDFLIARMIEIAQLALLVRERTHRRAVELARALIDELLAAGMLGQARMALRHVAALLADLGEYSVAARVLDAAGASPTATELVGEAVAEEAALRHKIEHELDTATVSAGLGAEPLAAGALWSEVDAVLRRYE